MPIDQLQIQNYRCFEKVEMNLHPHFNLLVGNNGSGKTTEDEIRKFDRVEDRVLLEVINSAITSMIPEWKDMAFSFREDDLVGILDGEERYFRQLTLERINYFLQLSFIVMLRWLNTKIMEL